MRSIGIARVSSVLLAAMLLADAAIVGWTAADVFEPWQTVWAVAVFLLYAGAGLWVLLRWGGAAYVCAALLGVAGSALLTLVVLVGNVFSDLSSPGSAWMPDGFLPLLLLQVAIAIVAIALLIWTPHDPRERSS